LRCASASARATAKSFKYHDFAHLTAAPAVCQRTFAAASSPCADHPLNLSPRRRDPRTLELETRRKPMSRKLILTIAAAALVASSFASQSADARGFGGGFGRFGGGGFARLGGGGHFGGGFGGGFRGHGGGRIVPILDPGRGGHGGGHGGGRGFPPVRGPRHPFPPIVWHDPHHHHHGHWVFRGGRWIIIDEVAVDAVAVGAAAAAVADPAPGPCTCLIKTYTPNGLVVFSDMCTKESASAPVSASTSDATQTPTSLSAAPMSPAQVSDMSKAVDYDGRPYADYLAANPDVAQAQAAQAQAQAQAQAAQSQPAPQK
jgi:hypothetical protein